MIVNRSDEFLRSVYPVVTNKIVAPEFNLNEDHTYIVEPFTLEDIIDKCGFIKDKTGDCFIIPDTQESLELLYKVTEEFVTKNKLEYFVQYHGYFRDSDNKLIFIIVFIYPDCRIAAQALNQVVEINANGVIYSTLRTIKSTVVEFKKPT